MLAFCNLFHPNENDKSNNNLETYPVPCLNPHKWNKISICKGFIYKKKKPVVRSKEATIVCLQRVCIFVSGYATHLGHARLYTRRFSYTRQHTTKLTKKCFRATLVNSSKIKMNYQRCRACQKLTANKNMTLEHFSINISRRATLLPLVISFSRSPLTALSKRYWITFILSRRSLNARQYAYVTTWLVMPPAT